MQKDVKKKIVKSAYQLFNEKGYNETTVMDICDVCHITKTTFYRYISSKEDLLSYFFDDISDDLGTLIINLAHADNYWSQIIYAFDLIVNRMNRFGRKLYSQLYISNLNKDNGTFDEIKVLKEIVITLIEKAQMAQQIENQGNPAELYELCENICFGCGIRWCLNQIDDVHQAMLSSMEVALQVRPDLRIK